MSRLNRQDRRELLRKVTRGETEAAFEALPLSNTDFQALFDMLDIRLPVDGCDHTRRLTIAFLHEHSLPEGPVLRWLDENGGFCDCEVLANSEQAWQACKNYGEIR